MAAGSALIARLLQEIERAVSVALPEKPPGTGAESGGNPVWRQRGGVTAEFGDHRQLVEIEAPARDLVLRGGKRWRPLLLTLTCRLCGGAEATALALSPIVELAHNGSLIIDDIEDNADLRRGEPAVHLRHGLDLAINAGNLLYFLPASCIAAAQLGAATELQVVRLYSQAMQRMHYGQGLDILWHRDPGRVPAVAEYFTMCRFKSGSMAGLATGLGAVAAGAAAPLTAFLRRAGEEFGVSFQIIDDVRNLTTGNPGKRRGDDLIEGKKSLPVILYCRQDAPARRRMAELLAAIRRSSGVATTAGLVEEAITLLTAAGVIDEARSMAQDAYRQTLRGLYECRELGGATDALAVIEQLTDSLIA